MKQILSKRCNYVIYDPDQDRSEDYGFKKVCDEYQPTEEEQDQWSRYLLVCTFCLSVIVFVLKDYL